MAATVEGKGFRRGKVRASRHASRMFLLTFALAAVVGFFWLVAAYRGTLRDPRYLDGWVLACAMALQLAYHIALKLRRLSSAFAKRWRAVHIAAGILLIPLFASHTEFSLPDAALEWGLWGGFALVTLSGILGASLPMLQRRVAVDGVTAEGLMARRAALATQLQEVVSEAPPTLNALPAPPYQSWIFDFYQTRLQHHFATEPKFLRQLLGSKQHFDALAGEMESLSNYVDTAHKAKLEAIKRLLTERHRLDRQHISMALSTGWQLIHVPVTYALVVLVVFHVIVVYAFASGSL